VNDVGRRAKATATAILKTVIGPPDRA